MITVKADIDDFARLNTGLNKLAEQSGKTMKEVLPAQMRLLAVDLAYVTTPKGKSKSDNIRNMKKVAQRISEVYPSVAFIVYMVAQQNKGAGGRLAMLLRTNKKAKAQAIIDKYISRLKITIGTFDGGKLHKAQSESKHVRRRLLVLRPGGVNAYIKRKQKLVGFAKGGFASAARQLGGIRGIPGFASRKAMKAPGRGIISGSGKTLTVTMINEVDYLRPALKKGDEGVAIAFRAKMIDDVLQRIQDRKIRKLMRIYR